MLYDQNMLDTITLISFLVGIANYNENLTQRDKNDIMQCLDNQTKDILVRVQEELEKQNEMLREILERLKQYGNIQ